MIRKEKKSARILFRVTPSEKRQMEANSVASKYLNLSEYLRVLGLAGIRINVAGEAIAPSRGSGIVTQVRGGDEPGADEEGQQRHRRSA